MRSLFVKIFLWFWLAITLATLANFFLAITTQVGRTNERRRLLQEDRRQVALQLLSLYGRVAPLLYEGGGMVELDRYAGSAERPADARAFLFDANGKSLLPTREIPPAVRGVIIRAVGSDTAVQSDDDDYIARARPVVGSGGRRYIVVVGMPAVAPWAERQWLPIYRALGIRMLVSLFFGGIICYFLAWRLTAPVSRLRTAAQRLASGDLSARVGVVPGGAGSEVVDLARDLDRMAEQIESLMAAQKRLLGDISHELRSPLARISVALGLAHQHCSPPATGYLERIELESGRLNELIGELLTLTRLESGSEHLERKPVDLCPFMEKLAQDAGFEAQNRGRSVVITTCDPLTIVGDAEMLRRALENVIRNALRYSPEGSTVEIALRRVHDGMGSCAVISVRDHGPGVPEGALADLFLPFYRVADARDRQSGGTGIGLAITERAVRLHGGSVRAINAEGGGLLVELLIPAETTMHGSSAADVEGEP